jgi:hypothetical protein
MTCKEFINEIIMGDKGRYRMEERETRKPQAYGVFGRYELYPLISNGNSIRILRYARGYKVEFLWKDRPGLSWMSTSMANWEFKVEVARARYSLGLDLEPWESILNGDYEDEEMQWETTWMQ